MLFGNASSVKQSVTRKKAYLNRKITWFFFQEISCQLTNIREPENTDNIKRSTIEDEHQNQVLGTPENSHIYYVEKIKNFKL